MTFEEQVRKMCEDAVACESEHEAIEIIRKLRAMVHSRIENTRSNLITLPPIGLAGIEKPGA